MRSKRRGVGVGGGSSVKPREKGKARGLSYRDQVLKAMPQEGAG